jgi:hypothetical protein
MNNKVGYYRDMFCPTPAAIVDVVKILEGIRDGKWKDQVQSYRSTKNVSIKNKLPCFTVSGVFENDKSIKNLKSQSGLLSLDIDDFKGTRDDLVLYLSTSLYQNIFSIFKSTGGEGYCVLVAIKQFEDCNQYQRIYESIYQTLNKDGLGEMSKFDYLPNLNRLRYVSYDPDIVINEKALEWVEEAEIEKQVIVVEKNVAKKFSVGGQMTDSEKLEIVLKNYVDYAGDFGSKGTRHDWVLGLARWACRADIDEKYLTFHIQSNYHNSSRPDIWHKEIAKCVRDSYKSYSAERGQFEVVKKFSYDDILSCSNIEQVKEQVLLLIADKLNYVDYLKKEGKNTTFVEKEIKFMKKVLNYL